MSTIDDIKARLEIVEVVRGYVPELKKMGRTWKARCPFHSERTPSFNVDPERGTWHCFGSCATGGDVIEFVRRKEGLDFREALRLCADRAGVELRPPSPRETEERETHARLLAANEAAAVFYQAALAGPDGVEARAYAAKRGLDETTCSTWQLGYAPEGWRTLTDHLVARGFTEADLVEAGLALRSEARDSVYDRFRDRLMFPTRDARRRLIGFGARALKPDDEPKYLNTPQTPLFDKSGNLYGLDRAADSIRSLDQAIVVEGYMDVIGPHQFGVTNVVASNGTSITDKQMALLKRYTQHILLVLDGDAAGLTAAQRGSEVAREALGDIDQAGKIERARVSPDEWKRLIKEQDFAAADVRVVSLSTPDGVKHDPDSMVRSDPDAFRALLKKSESVPDFIFNRTVEGVDLEDPRERSRIVQVLLPTVAEMADPVARSYYVQKLGRIGHVDEATIVTMLAKAGVGGPRPVATNREVAQAKKTTVAPPDGEAQLLMLLLQRREARAAGVSLAPATFEDSVNQALFEAWVAQVDLEERLGELDESLRERYDSLHGAPMVEYEPRHVPAMVEDMARRLRIGRAAGRLRAVALEQAQALQTARRSGMSDDARTPPPSPSPLKGEGTEMGSFALKGEGAEMGPSSLDGDVDAADEFNETVRRQRELTREFQVATGRRSADVDRETA